MSFITTIPEDQAEGAVKKLYDAVAARFGYVPNMAKVFSQRPQVWDAWSALLASISSNMDPRRYELVTLAAARELRSSYCMLAHGSILARDFYNAEEVEDIVNKSADAKLSDIDKAIMHFAQKVACDASTITEIDVEGLKKVGLTDQEIFDVASAAAARCFFSKTLDALGVHPDSAYNELHEHLRKTLTVGRPIA